MIPSSYLELCNCNTGGKKKTDDLISIVVLGSTGTGKSATCNSLCHLYNAYPESDSASSETYATTAREVQLRGI